MQCCCSIKPAGTCHPGWLFPRTSPCCHCRQNHPSSIRWKISGGSCARTGCRTGCSHPTRTFSITAARLGTSLPVDLGSSCPLACATRLTNADQGDLVLEAGEQLSFLSREAPQQDAAHGEIEQHFTGLNQAFVVLGEPPVGGQPCQCSLHYRSYNGAKFPNAGEVPTGLSSQASEVALGR